MSITMSRTTTYQFQLDPPLYVPHPASRDDTTMAAFVRTVDITYQHADPTHPDPDMRGDYVDVTTRGYRSTRKKAIPKGAAYGLAWTDYEWRMHHAIQLLLGHAVDRGHWRSCTEDIHGAGTAQLVCDRIQADLDAYRARNQEEPA